MGRAGPRSNRREREKQKTKKLKEIRRNNRAKGDRKNKKGPNENEGTEGPKVPRRTSNPIKLTEPRETTDSRGNGAAKKLRKTEEPGKE